MPAVACIILAAGEGTRMRSAVPKLLHPLCGRPLVDYVADTVKVLRCRPVVAVVGAGAREVRRHLPTAWRVAQQTRRRGTGHAVGIALRALPRAVQQVLILYGDQPLITTATIRAVVEAHRTTAATCTVLTASVPDPTHFGRIVRRGERLVRIVEDADASPEERHIHEVNVGVAVCRRQPLAEALRHIAPTNAQREYYLTDAITWLASHHASGEVRCYHTPDTEEALGINTRQDLAEAARIVRARVVRQLMADGVTVVDPRTAYVDPGVRIGKDSTIFPCTVIERDVVIGARCTIGPFARIRSGVRLANDVRIGNFAEVVRSRVGARVRMNHVSYLGDAVVEPDVNVGAGTITANFDGRAKHVTRIGARAFLGSGTVIVAPATVGKRAVTGAGCVITRGTRVKPGTVVVGVPARELHPRKT